LVTCVTNSCMQYVLANNQLLQVVWVGLLEHTSFPDTLYVEAMFAQKRTFVLQFSAPGVVKPCLCYPKKCSTIPERGDNLSPDRQTMSTQQATSALYTTFLALVVWPLPAAHSHWQVHTTLPGLMWRFCSLAPPSSKFWLRSYFITPLLPAPLLQNHP